MRRNIFLAIALVLQSFTLSSHIACAHFTATGLAVPQKTLPFAPPSNYVVGTDVGGARLSTLSNSKTKSHSLKHCVVTPLGWDLDDAPQIQAAVEKCGINGTITLPAPFVYNIKSRLFMKLVSSKLNILGTLSFAADLGYWIRESHRVQFQNMSTAWIVEGQDFIIDGGGWQQGGINGNGQAWYTYAQGHSNTYGRPISLTIFNSSNAKVQSFSIRDPQFWSFYIQDSHDIILQQIYINGTNTDPNGNSSNFETNVDGFDSVRVNKLTVKDWLFRGGDDCTAPKSNTTNLVISNMTCIGGGIAFGSVGQFIDYPDFIINVSVSDVQVASNISPLYGGSQVSGGAYFKSWVGVAEGHYPNGGGGGIGNVSNITISNLSVDNTTQAIYINKCYHKVPSQANFCDTSRFLFEKLTFHNVTGKVSGEEGVNLNCSAAAPCADLTFSGISLESLALGNTTACSTCDNAYGVEGIQCQPTC